MGVRGPINKMHTYCPLCTKPKVGTVEMELIGGASTIYRGVCPVCKHRLLLVDCGKERKTK